MEVNSTLSAPCHHQGDLEEMAQIKQSEMDLNISVDACCRKRKRPQEEHSLTIPTNAKRLQTHLTPPKHARVTARALKHGLQDIPDAVDSSSSSSSRSSSSSSSTSA